MENFLLVTDTSDDSCLEKARRHIKAAKSEGKTRGVSNKASVETGRQERLLGMFSFVG